VLGTRSVSGAPETRPQIRMKTGVCEGALVD
jgi:hypothetical protein